MMKESVTIIVPIHNKEKYIINTIQSIKNQNYSNYNLLLLLDNCTDSTEELILNSSDLKDINDYTIYYSQDNKFKKSGALNQLIMNNINLLKDYVMILDADTVIEEDTITKGMQKLLSNEKLAAVCSKAGVVEYEGNNLWEKIVWTVQHIEYAQFDSHRIETEGKIKVVHGMCAIFRKKALLDVAKHREETMDKKDNIYLEDNLVEDYELTICLKMLGWKVSACMEMKAFTEVPLSVKELFIQRLRWLRGGVDTLRSHKIDKHTLADNLSNVLFIIINIMKMIINISVIIYIMTYGFYVPNVIVLLVFTVTFIDGLYRMKYIDNLSLFDFIIKFILLPEIMYFWMQTLIMAMSLVMSYLNIEQRW